MTAAHLEYVALAADGVLMLLCLWILLLLSRHGKRIDRLTMPLRQPHDTLPFRREFMLQSLKHQSEQAFDNLQSMLQKERRNVARMFDIGDDPRPAFGEAAGSDDVNLQRFVLDRAAGASADSGGPNPRYHRALELAAEGLDASLISKRLDIPLGEVELLVKLSGSPDGHPSIGGRPSKK